MESVHEGKKSHACSVCESSFAQKSTLRQHMESVHQDKKPHKCPKCESSEPSGSEIVNLMLIPKNLFNALFVQPNLEKRAL